MVKVVETIEKKAGAVLGCHVIFKGAEWSCHVVMFAESWGQIKVKPLKLLGKTWGHTTT